MTSKPKPPLPRWRIVLIRKKGDTLGTVEARTADEAIKVAIERFGIKDPNQQKRLAAHPVEER